MTTFGFSAFLKLIHLNERPRRTELRNRLRGSEGGYDYHRSLRGLAKKLIVDGRDITSVAADADLITGVAERKSAKAGINVLERWRAANTGGVFPVNRATVESPSGVYKVAYSPDFGIDLAGGRTAVHVWNTMKPNLERRMVMAALAPFVDPMAEQGFDEVAVLSLRDGQLYRLADPASYIEHSSIILEHIERLIEDIRDDGRRPPAEDRPLP